VAADEDFNEDLVNHLCKSMIMILSSEEAPLWYTVLWWWWDQAGHGVISRHRASGILYDRN